MRIGFIGMGQVARTFGAVLCDKNNEQEIEVWGFDSLLDEKRESFEKRFHGLPVRFSDSLE
jgi:pyrroline-5-carboxylate reductase